MTHRRLALVVAGALSLCPATASAATFSAACSGTTGDAASLRAAITGANGTEGDDTVALGAGCRYVLGAPDNFWYGPNGLPPILSGITIEGNGATIARFAGSVPFRLLFVGADPASPDTSDYVSRGPGRLTLRDVTLANGLAKGGDSFLGGGGAGMGGAIFSQGTVLIERSTLMGNVAGGGSPLSDSAGSGGGGIGTDAIGNTGGGFGPGLFGGGSGGSGSGQGGGGGAGFRVAEDGNPSASGGGAGGGPATGTGGSATSGSAGDGSGGGGTSSVPGGVGGGFGGGGTGPPSSQGAGGGGGVGGGGGRGLINAFGRRGGGGGFGAGGGFGGVEPGDRGGAGGFGGGGGGGAPGGAPGFGGGTPGGGTGGGGAGMGAAIFNMHGRLTIQNSTLGGNAAVGGNGPVPDGAGKGLGGAVFNLSGAFTAIGSTLDGNQADDGASIYNLVYDAVTARQAVTVLRDTIVANGARGLDLVSNKTAQISPSGLGSATAFVGERNLVGALAPREFGSIIGAPLTGDPKLGPLQDNGGPTPTMLPAADSPAIDAGSAFGLATDQRGLPRPFDFASIPNAGDGSDIGAVERPAGGAGGGGPAGGNKDSPLAFGRRTLVTLRLGAKRIPARGPLSVIVSNANRFGVSGRLSGETAKRIVIGHTRRRLALKAKTLSVPAGGVRTIRLGLSTRLSRLLVRTGTLALRLRARVGDPAGHTRTVTNTVAVRPRRARPSRASSLPKRSHA